MIQRKQELHAKVNINFKKASKSQITKHVREMYNDSVNLIIKPRIKTYIPLLQVNQPDKTRKDIIT